MESSSPRADVVRVADTFVTLMRSFNRAKAKLLAAAEHDVDWSSHMVLRCIANEGPMRAGAVAEYLQTDPSTVSRQVAAMVKEGLLERRADPEDGRASILVLTARADQVLAEHDEIRIQHFAQLLDGWDERDLRTFAQLLHRFTTDYDTASHDWITERIATRFASAERTR
jgi:DNA-binding MarR family transcriptional regulator